MLKGVRMYMVYTQGGKKPGAILEEADILCSI